MCRGRGEEGWLVPCPPCGPRGPVTAPAAEPAPGKPPAAPRPLRLLAVKAATSQKCESCVSHGLDTAEIMARGPRAPPMDAEEVAGGSAGSQLVC